MRVISLLKNLWLHGWSVQLEPEERRIITSLDFFLYSRASIASNLIANVDTICNIIAYPRSLYVFSSCFPQTFVTADKVNCVIPDKFIKRPVIEQNATRLFFIEIIAVYPTPIFVRVYRNSHLNLYTL